jgi:hypothetical protein
MIAFTPVAQGDGKGAPLSSISTEPRAGGLLMSDPSDRLMLGSSQHGLPSALHLG